MKLTGEDLAALVLVQVAGLLIVGGIFYVALRFKSLDWTSPFNKIINQ